MVHEKPAEEQIRLARELLAGNTSALDRFVTIFQTKVFQYSYLMCGQREDAEEVAQDTLLKMSQSFDQLRDPERVRSWVFQIARNNCLMKRRRSIFAPSEELPLSDTVMDDTESPDEQALRGELRSHIYAAIRRLTPMYRAVVLLRDVEGLTTEETAEILEVSADVVKTRLHRARASLREDLKNFDPEIRPRELPSPVREQIRSQFSASQTR